MGGDVVGMSVVYEILTAADCNITCLGIAGITNVCDDGEIMTFDVDETLRIHANIPVISRRILTYLIKILQRYFNNTHNLHWMFSILSWYYHTVHIHIVFNCVELFYLI